MKKRAASNSCFAGKLQKAGAGHIEIIFSFLLFIVVVGIALFFFRPGAGDRLIDVSLDYVELEVFENTSVVLEVYSVWVNDTLAVGDIEIMIPGVDASLSGVRVSDKDGVILNSGRDGNSVFVRGPAVGWNGIDFIYVSFGEEFTNDVSAGTYDETYYRVGSSEIKEIISENRMEDLVSYYNSNYFELKDDFTLSDRVNFGFGVLELEAQKEIPANFEVFSNTERVEVLRSDGKIVFAEFTAKVW